MWAGAPLASNMQRDMQCDVTCCTVTFTFPHRYTLLSIWKKGGHALHRQKHGKAPAPDPAERGRFTPLSLSAATRVSGKAGTHEEFLSEMYDQKGVYDASHNPSCL